jgi:uncharacterized protein (TIGR03066 family)
MKKVLSIVAIAMLFIATSCSKEAKLNRKLDGEWNVTTVDGVAPEAGTSMSIKFEKDEKGTGKVTMTETGGGMSFSLPGTYTLTDDKSISMVLTFMGDAETSVFTVSDYSKSELTMADEDGSVFKLEKK